MSRNNIHAYYHIVFATKYREPLLRVELQPYLYIMLWNKCHLIGCDAVIINGMEDHIHVLLNANPQLSISKTLKDIKGASSRWLNENYTFDDKFSWQRGYGLFTVSPKEVPIISKYIQNQKAHHTNKAVIEKFEII